MFLIAKRTIPRKIIATLAQTVELTAKAMEVIEHNVIAAQSRRATTISALTTQTGSCIFHLNQKAIILYQATN